MKRITSSTKPTRKVMAGNSEIDDMKLSDLRLALSCARDIMDDMDDATFEVVKDKCGKSFYDDVLDSVRMLDTVL